MSRNRHTESSITVSPEEVEVGENRLTASSDSIPSR